ncbi:Lysine biosynthesis regulatory protein LYS14 [Spathaspora sp. JA1]|nr:Lysine biosynthesis regulatory protein LYS14 [Spathaspora sp. JA1]
MESNKPIIKKRKYSRGGCLECKRRKIKCDETKPSCLYCVRMKKPCSYKPNTTANHTSNSLSIRFYNSTGEFTKSEDSASVASDPLIDSLNEDPLFFSNIDPNDLQLLFDDATSLIHDSHDLFQLTDFDQLLNTVKSEEPPIAREPPVIEQPPIISNNIKVPTNKDLLASTLNGMVRNIDESYLNTLTQTDLNYHLFPYSVSPDSNPVIRILLQYSKGCRYLLYSMLASSATFQYIKTRNEDHNKYRELYISQSLRYLTEAFPEGSGNHQDGTIMVDFEKLLLTVLLLASIFTATTYLRKINNSHKTSWKSHLLHVKDLLMQYTKITSSKGYMSDGLALAKTWFFAIESMAELNDPLGGTLIYDKKNSNNNKNIIEIDSELDVSDTSRLWLETGYFNRGSNPEYHDALVKIGVLTDMNLPIPSQFNLFIGFSIEIVQIIDEITKCLDLLRETPKNQVSSIMLVKIMALIDKARNNYFVPQVNKSGDYSIPIESAGHPDYIGVDKLNLPLSCFAQYGSTYYSWFDMNEQLVIDEMLLRTLTTPGLLLLPRTHPLIDELKQKMLKSMFFIKPKQSHINEPVLCQSEHFYLPSNLFTARAIMIEASIGRLSRILDQDIEFEQIELYFTGLIKLGNGSSKMALEMVKRLRKGEVEIDHPEVIPFC